MPIVPDKLVNFEAYGGAAGIRFLGMVDAEMPGFEAMTETISGAGIAGEFDSPVIGHFKSHTVKLKWRVPTTQTLLLLAPIIHVIDLRGSTQVIDPGTGLLTTVSLRVEVRGPVKMVGLGKLEPGKPTDAECEIEAIKIMVAMAGVLIVELDKLNFRFIVGGVDYLTSVRADTGGL